MNILYIGDIMGEPGIKIVSRVLPDLKKSYRIDLVIAQAENVSGGKGMLPSDMRHLQKIGVDFFTGGNHTPKKRELFPILEDETQPVIGPANMADCPGEGWKVINTKQGNVLVISILGETFGRKKVEITNPLHELDRILALNKTKDFVAKIVNFHGDYSSEKVIAGYYLDGRVTAVIGDHWHTPTADPMILPVGTAHITDVGMCGALHASLGVKLESVIPRWRDGKVTKNELETSGPLQFNAVLVNLNTKTGLAERIELLQRIIN